MPKPAVRAPGRATVRCAAQPAPLPPGDYRHLLRSVDREFIEPVELAVSGTLPADLKGTLYGNGPGLFESQGQRVRHLFDPQALLKAVHLKDGRATYQSRLLVTRQQWLEDTLRRRLFGGAGWLPAGGLLGMLMGLRSKNTANTHIIAYAGRLLALNEGGLPYRIDPHTLATCGPETFGGLLGDGDTFSAHPKVHPTEGDLYNFGVTLAPRSSVHLFRIGQDGHGTRVTSFRLPGMASTHDFFLTETRAVFVVAPLHIEALDMLRGKVTPRDGVRFAPEEGSQIICVDLRSGDVVRHTLHPALVSFHGINAWDEEDGSLTLDLCSYDDADVLPTLHDMLDDKEVPTSRAAITRLHIDGDHVKRTTLAQEGFDFPRVQPSMQGRAHSQVRGVAWGPASPLPYVPVTLAEERGRWQLHATQPAFGEYFGEGVPAHGSGRAAPYWLHFVHCAEHQRSELRIYDGCTLGSSSELCRVALPQAVPFGFHGNWLPAGQHRICVA